MTKLLVADGDSYQRALLGKILTRHGQVVEAPCGATALTEFENGLINKVPFDGVFLEITLPVTPGQEVIRKLRALEKQYLQPKTAIFVVASLGDPNAIAEAFNADCDEYIVKPYPPEEIVNLLKDYGVITH